GDVLPWLPAPTPGALWQCCSLDQPHALHAVSPLAALALSDGLRRARLARLSRLGDAQPAYWGDHPLRAQPHWRRAHGGASARATLIPLIPERHDEWRPSGQV